MNISPLLLGPEEERLRLAFDSVTANLCQEARKDYDDAYLKKVFEGFFQLLKEIGKNIIVRVFETISMDISKYEDIPSHTAGGADIYDVLEFLGNPIASTMLLQGDYGEGMYIAYDKGKDVFIDYIVKTNPQINALRRCCMICKSLIDAINTLGNLEAEMFNPANEKLYKSPIVDTDLDNKLNNSAQQYTRFYEVFDDIESIESFRNTILAFIKSVYQVFSKANHLSLTRFEKDILIKYFDNYLLKSLDVHESISVIASKWDEEESVSEESNQNNMDTNSSSEELNKLVKDEWIYKPGFDNNSKENTKSVDPNEYLGLKKGIEPDDNFYAFINHMAKLGYVDCNEDVLHTIAFRLSGYDRTPEIVESKPPVFKGPKSKNNLAFILFSIVKKKPMEGLKQNKPTNTESSSAYTKAQSFFKYEQKETKPTLGSSYGKNADPKLKELVELYFAKSKEEKKQ